MAKETKTNTKRLYRSKNDKVIAGVCSGVAKYIEVDPVVVRLIWAIMCFAAGAGIIAYILAWIIVPKEP